MRKYAALISYAGTGFCGWQKQKGSAAEGEPSIQSTVEAALAQISGEEPSVVGSGRTDSGVHSTGQVAHFVLKKREWKPEVLRNGLNSQLPPSIRVAVVREVPLDFHAQRSAEKKRYSYFFQQGSCALPHLEPYSWWIRKRLDLAAMNEALAHLCGEHDFKPFQASGAKPGPTVRKILEAEAVVEPIVFPGMENRVVLPPAEIAAHAGGEVDFRFIRMRVTGTGFLKQMVRGIAGTLLQIGEGRRPASDILEILRTGDRGLVGPTAPARALWLERVWYHELDFSKPEQR